MAKATWLTQGGFLFACNGTRLLVDPYMSNYLEKNHHLTRLAPFPLAMDKLKPDWLVCTHDHFDHLDPETVENIARVYPHCRFAGPRSCHRHFGELGIAAERCQPAEIGTTLECGAFDLIPAPAFHSDPHAIGLVLAAEGRRIYISGDSNYSPTLVNPQTVGCYTLFICINGKLGNMGLDDALRVVKSLRPRRAIPMHYGLFAENTTDPKVFIDGCRASGVESFAMTPGEEFVL